MLTSNWQKMEAQGSLAWPDSVLGEDMARAHERAKRAFDVALSCAALVVLSPLLLLIAAVVRLGSPGGVFFVSDRVGRNGRKFESLKFRTLMQDGRLTSVGRVLKRFGLDELPQLVNVLRGEMSIVGPRPVMACQEVHAQAPYYRRFSMRPGITGLWAIAGDLNPLDGYVSLDETYRSHWSISRDLAIVLRSLGTALLGE